MANKLTFAIAIKLMSDEFQKGANAVKNSLRSIQMQVLTFATALGAGGLGLSGLITKFKDVARETSRVTTALKNVSGDTKGFADNLKFINDLATKYGLEVNALVSNFASFTASANQANMPMKDQVKIFESLSKASTAFALSSEQTDGVFLALTQMMGKGKISMEELRNQMGEKLPIAMSAMAKALGVSVAEMDKLVSSGKVMSADVLPKFADALSEMIPEVDTDNLESSLNRLSNAFRDVVDSSGFQSKYKSLIDGLTQLIQIAGENVKTIVQGVISVILGLIALSASKTLKTMWATTDVVTENIKKLTAVYQAEGVKIELIDKQIATTRQKYIDSSGQAQKKYYRELVALQKEKQALIVSQGKAQLAMETAMAERVPSLWTRSLGVLKLGIAKLGIAIKSLWTSFAPMIIITGLTMIGQKLYELATSTTVAEKAMNDFNAESLKETKNLNSVFDAYRKANDGTKEKDRLLGVIKSKYGDYIKNLIDEKGRITDIDKAQKQANESLRQSLALKIKNAAISEVTESEVKKQAKSMGNIRGRLSNKLGDKKANSMINHIGELISNDTRIENGEEKKIPYSEIQREIVDYIKKETGESQYVAKYTGLTNNDLFDIISSAQKLRDETESIENQFKGIIGNYKEPEIITDPYTPPPPDTKKKTKDNTQKVIDEQLKLQNAKAKAELDARNKELQNQQSLLDLEQDGFDKQQKQIDLNHKKEILGIDTRTQDLIEKQQDAERQLWDIEHPDSSKTKEVFRTKTNSYADLSDANKAELITSDDIAYKQKEKAESDLLKSLLEKYQDYNAKRLAIDKEYGKNLEVLNKQLLVDPNNDAIKASIVQLGKDWKEAISTINTDELKNSIDWQYVFGDLDRVSTQSIEKLKNKLSDYIKKESKNLSPVDLKALQDALENLNNKYAELKPNKAFADSFEAYKVATADVKRLRQELEQLKKTNGKIVGIEYDKSTGKMTPIIKSVEQAEKDLADAQNNRANAQANLGKSIEGYAGKLQKILDIANQLISSMEGLGIEVSDSFKDSLDGLDQFATGLGEFGANMASKNYFGAVQSGIKSIGGLAKTVSKLFGGGGKSEYQKLKEKYDSLNKVWDSLISKKKEYISTSYGSEVKEVGEEAKAIVNKQVEANRTLGKSFMNSFKNKGGSSWGVRQQSRINGDDWKDLAEWKNKNNISDDLYKSVTTGRMTGLFDLTGKQLEKLQKEAPTLWAKLNTETQEWLENIISGEKQLEEITLAVNEQLTNISLDSFTNGYIDKLTDLKSTNKELADNFAENMRKAILDSLVNKKYSSEIEKLHQDWADAMSLSDGDLSKGVYDQLIKEQKALSSAMLAERDKLAQKYGWDVSSSTSQSSTVGYSVSMDQDTGGAILGRITGLHETAIRMSEILNGLSINTSSYTASATLCLNEMQKQTEILNDSFQIHKKSYFKIEQMTEKMDKLDAIEDKLSSIDKNTKKL